MVSDIEDSTNIGMVAETPHGLRFARDALAGAVVQFLGLDQGKRDIPVKQGVVGEVDLLLAALAEQFLNLVSTVSEGGWLNG